MDFERDELMQTFISECGENFETIEQTLVALEADPSNKPLLGELFRAAHTFKGNASCVGFTAVAPLAHAIEDRLDQVRSGKAGLTPALVTLLLDCVDGLRTAMAISSANDEHLPAEHALVLEQLTASVTGIGTSEVAAAEPSDESARESFRSRTLRVDVTRLDRMLDLAGEIAIARERMRQLIEGGASLADLLEAHSQADTLHADMQGLVMKVRMVSIGPSFRQHARTVRDASAITGRQAQLVVEGEDVELDTRLVDGLRDPLTHMVRNAVSHGIELPDDRIAGGKNPCGTVTLRARRDGGSIVIEVSDDGRGIDRAAVFAQAVAKGLVSPHDRLTDPAIYALMFQPGFSTAAEITSIAGRGVGMDVVQRNIEALHGTIEIHSREGIGTSFLLRLPLTLAIIDGFVVTAAGEQYILPLDSVVECLQFSGAPSADTFGLTEVRGVQLPYVRLRRYFELGGAASQRENLVVLSAGSLRAGLVIDALLGRREVVIKPLSRLFQRIPGLSGSAVLGNGRVAIILDVAALLSSSVERAASEVAAGEIPIVIAGSSSSGRAVTGTRP